MIGFVDHIEKLSELDTSNFTPDGYLTQEIMCLLYTITEAQTHKNTKSIKFGLLIINNDNLNSWE